MWRASADATVKLVAAGCFILVCVAYFLWPDLARHHATATANDLAFTVYTREVAPGGTIDAHLRLDGGQRAAIGSIIVSGAGDDQRFGGFGKLWGDQIPDTLDEATATADFAIEVPHAMAPGSVLHLQVTVYYVEAHTMPALTIAGESLAGAFTNESSHETFDYDIAVSTPLAATLGKLGRVALALGSWFAVIAVISIGARWYARRRRTPPGAWLVLAIPYAYVGYAWFATQLTIATGASAIPFVVLAIVTWLAALVVASRVADSASRRRYQVVSAIPKAEPAREPDPYRSPGSVKVRTATVEAVTTAWLTRGLLVIEKRGTLVVGMMDGSERAVVTIPASRVFGDAPFEIRARYRRVVDDMLGSLVPLLGPLRCRVDDDRRVLSFGVPT